MTVAGVPNIAGEGTWWMCGDTYLLTSCRDDQDQYKMPLIPGSKQESDLCSQLRNRLGHPTHHYNTITTPHSLTEYCCEAARRDTKRIIRLSSLLLPALLFAGAAYNQRWQPNFVRVSQYSTRRKAPKIIRICKFRKFRLKAPQRTQHHPHIRQQLNIRLIMSNVVFGQLTLPPLKQIYCLLLLTHCRHLSIGNLFMGS